jgi:hypothetical protein
MPKKSMDPLHVSELATALVRVVESLKRLGGSSYPATLGRVSEIVERKLSDPLFKEGLKLTQGGEFTPRLTVLGPAKPTSLILFQSDLTNQVAKIVDFGLGSLKPGATTTLKKLCPVKDRAILATFIPAVEQELALRLSEHLVTRGMDPSSHSYLTPRQASDLLRLSLSSADFRKIVAVAGLLWFGGKDAQKCPWILLAKIENYSAVFESDEWLVGAVNAVCTAKGTSKRILRAVDLLPGFPQAQKRTVAKALDARVEAERLPAPLVGIVDGKEAKVLRREDLRPESPTQAARLIEGSGSQPKRELPVPPGELSPSPLKERLLHAIDRLRRQRGANQVNLLDLRREMEGASRSEFDLALEQLRRDRQVSLASAEGRGGITREEQEAAVREGDALLLFVERRLD